MDAGRAGRGHLAPGPVHVGTAARRARAGGADPRTGAGPDPRLGGLRDGRPCPGRSGPCRGAGTDAERGAEPCLQPRRRAEAVGDEHQWRRLRPDRRGGGVGPAQRAGDQRRRLGKLPRPCAAVAGGRAQPRGQRAGGGPRALRPPGRFLRCRCQHRGAGHPRGPAQCRPDAGGPLTHRGWCAPRRPRLHAARADGERREPDRARAGGRDQRRQRRDRDHRHARPCSGRPRLWRRAGRDAASDRPAQRPPPCPDRRGARPCPRPARDRRHLPRPDPPCAGVAPDPAGVRASGPRPREPAA